MSERSVAGSQRRQEYRKQQLETWHKHWRKQIWAWRESRERRLERWREYHEDEL